MISNAGYAPQPKDAGISRGQDGQVECSFTIAPDGSGTDLKILTSSDFPIFDGRAMTASRSSR